jgi:hypothetical protein
MINNLYCFMTYRGDFKEHDPPSVIRMKRNLDRRTEIVKPVFGSEFRAAYDAFIGLCFETYAGINRDARLKTGFGSRKESWGPEWQLGWEQLFIDDETQKADRDKLTAAYERLMQALASDLNLVGIGARPEKRSLQP